MSVFFLGCQQCFAACSCVYLHLPLPPCCLSTTSLPKVDTTLPLSCSTPLHHSLPTTTMSTSDLRGSLREALSFQPTYRARKATQKLPAPYLDRVSVSEHKGSPKDNHRSSSKRKDGLDASSWKELSIRPISMPDLSHTKLQTVFDPESVPFTAPTGKILKGMRTTLRRGYIDAVKSTKEDVERERRNRMSRERGEEQYDDRHEQSQQQVLFDRTKYEEDRAYEELDATNSQESLKTESSYSAPPKFEVFLDFVYGPSNLTGSYRRSYNSQMKEYLPVPR